MLIFTENFKYVIGFYDICLYDGNYNGFVND